MLDFNTIEYERMIGDIIHDTFYIDRSIQGKISGIRQFSEILVRKILNIGHDRKLMLGSISSSFKKELDAISDARRSDLFQIIEKIRPYGNDATHTQHVEEFSDSDLNLVIDGLFDLYAYLFIDYFLEFPIDLLSFPPVLRTFSQLPPVVRYKTFKYFYEKSPNLQIANRYLLSIIKVYGKEKAREWLENEKENILAIPYPTSEEAEEYYIKCGVPTNDGILVSIKLWEFNNVYDLLVDKINDSNTSINEAGKLYSDFEEAKGHYFANKIDINSEELKKYYDFTELSVLYDIMDFVYLGRTNKTGR